MPFVTVGVENSADIKLYYEDHGKGKPVVLIHGFPMSGAAWEKQTAVLLSAGYRVITYDRRGFGKSSQPTFGYDYDVFAADLQALMTKLDLHAATLIGHSMGSGEIVRYIARYGSDRVEKAVLVSPLQPFLLKAVDNPDGLDDSIFAGFQASILEDRLAYLTKFYAEFYGAGVFTKGKNVSEPLVQYHWSIGAAASPTATFECVATWKTDFRKDLSKLTIPTLIIQGTDDRILPFPITGKRLHESLPSSQLVPVEGAPHGLLWTHADAVNEALLAFLRGSTTHRSVA